MLLLMLPLYIRESFAFRCHAEVAMLPSFPSADYHLPLMRVCFFAVTIPMRMPDAADFRRAADAEWRHIRRLRFAADSLR